MNKSIFKPLIFYSFNHSIDLIHYNIYYAWIKFILGRVPTMIMNMEENMI